MLVAVVGCRRDEPRQVRTTFMESTNTPVRIGMAELHLAGGVPPGWVFALPGADVNAGRDLFFDYGCPACHVVQGEDFNPPAEDLSPGPELSGMGTHHPPVYFVESILNPDAVIVEGEGYTGKDGLSTMPAYPDMKSWELINLVAYLQSLTDASGHVHHGRTDSFSGRVDLTREDLPAAADTTPIPAGSASKATVFFTQTYSVRSGQLPALEKWFAAVGLPAFRSYPDLLELETFVDQTRGPESVVTLFGFADMDALRAFLAERRIAEALDAYGGFAELADRQIYESRPVYPVASLSSVLGGDRRDPQATP